MNAFPDDQYSMSTNISNPNLLLHITLCNSGKPNVSRLLVVPSQMTFTELHEAIAVAFGWNSEPCTSWMFKMVDGDPLTVTKRDGPNKLKVTFAAYWRHPDQGYDVTTDELISGTQVPVGLYMKKARSRKYWTYDYNISIQPHAIEVINHVENYQRTELGCVGGYGYIDRNL